MQDFINSWVLITILLVIAAVVSFTYILIMRWIIAPFIYGSFVLLVAALAFVIYFCINKYITLKSNTTFTWTTNVSYYFR
jgi:hypothetical protein